MPARGVIDTGVLIGFTIKVDQHHGICRDYIVDGNADEISLSPTAHDEFKDISERIRTQLSRGVTAHRQSIQNEVSRDHLEREELEWIRDAVLTQDDAGRAYSFLYKFYGEVMQREFDIYRTTLLERLSNIEAEVWVDRSEEFGGWGSHVTPWAHGVDSYPDVENELLVCEGDDPTICIEAHHIAVKHGKDRTELGTTNPSHFIDQVHSEPESRVDNILRLTSLDDVIDLSGPKRPTP